MQRWSSSGEMPHWCTKSVPSSRGSESWHSRKTWSVAFRAACGSALAHGTRRGSHLFYSILNMACSIYTNGFFKIIPTDCQSSAEGKVCETQQREMFAKHSSVVRTEERVGARVLSPQGWTADCRSMTSHQVAGCCVWLHINKLMNCNLFFRDCVTFCAHGGRDCAYACGCKKRFKLDVCVTQLIS